MTLSILSQRDALGVKHALLYIDGEWRDASGDDVWTHRHPATGEEVGTFTVATSEDVDAAVATARRVFDEGGWSRMRAGERIKIMHRIADLIRTHSDELQRLIALDNSFPLVSGLLHPTLSPAIAADIFEHHAGWADKLAGETVPPYGGGDKITMTLREPVGVVAAIVPWNAPIMLAAQKLAPALAAGCTIVLKASENATFCIVRLVQLMEEAGLPPGVVNLVLGPGEPTGEALITHPGVDKISFTGSRAVGSRVAEAAAKGIKRVSLELGGKSPLIVFPDAPDVAAAGAMAMGMVTFGLSGQGCVVQSRALVQRDVYDEFLASCEAIAGMIVYGDPYDEQTNAPPLINERQLDRVLGLIRSGEADGARKVFGGDRPGGDLANGNFVNPTLFADVDNRFEVAQQEVFGPVLVAVPFDDEEEAVRLANDTHYGLGATVFSSDVKRALRMATRIRGGTIGINGFTVEPHVPFGGFKESGLGREGGREAIESYTELKTVFIPFTDHSA